MKTQHLIAAGVVVFHLCGCSSSDDATAPAVPTPTPEPTSCQFFPDSFVPFVRVYSTSDAILGNDRMVLGEMAPKAYDYVRSQLRLPRFVNEQYCDPVPLAPGLTVRAFVPTATERLGDYGQFYGIIWDPLTNYPFPGNVIPSPRLGGLLAWRIPGG